MEIYINALGSFLPGEPVDNESIERRLGCIGGIPSRTRKRILQNNKIATRHYAIDPDTGSLTHTNAALTAEAVRQLRQQEAFGERSIECLCCGTSSPDLLMPAHGVMVAGELALPPCEVVTTAGICVSGMTALKYACMNVATGAVENAVATGSELASSFMRAGFFERIDGIDRDVEKKAILGFDADFLRWMLSDGAGAALVTGQKNRHGLSLRVEWIENRSFAGELPTCMYAGGRKNSDGSMTGWRQLSCCEEAVRKSFFAVRQDVKLLDEHVVPTAIKRTLVDVAKKHGLQPDDVDWYLPHYSSDYFRSRIFQCMAEAGFTVPYEKWFTNLYEVGNIGSASMYLLMEGLLHSGKLRHGDKILCFIPESGRFSHCFMLLSAIDGAR